MLRDKCEKIAIKYLLRESATVGGIRFHILMSGDTSDRCTGGGKIKKLPVFDVFSAILSQLSCCLSLPICCLNTMLLEAHQPWSVSCYRREVKRLFQLLSYWLGPPSGQARPSVNPAHNERRSLPTEKVSLWVYVMCPLALTRQIGSGRGQCVFDHTGVVKVSVWERFYVSFLLTFDFFFETTLSQTFTEV